MNEEIYIYKPLKQPKLQHSFVEGVTSLLVLFIFLSNAGQVFCCLLSFLLELNSLRALKAEFDNSWYNSCPQLGNVCGS